MTGLSKYDDWETWERKRQNIMNELYTNLLMEQNKACYPPEKKEYKPSADEIKEMVFALIASHSVTMIDLRDHSDNIISTVMEFFKKIHKKFE